MTKLDEIVYGNEKIKEMKQEAWDEYCKRNALGVPDDDLLTEIAKKYAKMIDDYLFHKCIEEGCFVQVASVEEALEKGYRVVICNAETRHEQVLSKGFDIKVLVYGDAPKDAIYVVTDKELESRMYETLKHT